MNVMRFSCLTFPIGELAAKVQEMCTTIQIAQADGYTVACEQFTPFLSGGICHYNYFVRFEKPVNDIDVKQ